MLLVVVKSDIRHIEPTYALTTGVGTQGTLFAREGQVVMVQSFTGSILGSIQVYERHCDPTCSWTQTILDSEEKAMGFAASDGNRIAVGLYFSAGSTGFSIFERNDTAWFEERVVHLPPTAGTISSIAINGTTVAAGAAYGIYVYDLQDDVSDPPTLVSPSPCSGVCYVKFLAWVGDSVGALYARSFNTDAVSIFHPTTGWSEEAVASFAAPAVGFTFGGDRLAFCIQTGHACYPHRLENLTWIGEGTIYGDTVQFGQSLQFWDQYLVVGSPNTLLPDSVIDTGAAFLYRFSDSEWTLEDTIYSTFANSSQFFGYSVGIDSQDVSVYAPFPGSDSPHLFITPIVAPI